MSTATRIAVVDSSQPGEARRTAVAMARKLGFDETDAGKIAIVVTEGATNLVKHGGGGEILLHAIDNGGAHGLEVIALDRGKGIRDVADSLRDGQSTSGSPGSGLGAILRLSASSDLYSRPGQGTAVLARFWPSRKPAAARAFEVEGISVAMSGEEVCGDDWAVDYGHGKCRILVVDGLGHGLAACEAAREAIHVFREHSGAEPVECMEAIHARLRSTRGAAAALAVIDPEERQLTYTGVGNIAGVIIDGTAPRSLVSMSGTLGHNMRALRPFVYRWAPDAWLVLHSDGVSGRWDLASYPGLTRRMPALAAAVLYRDMARGKDDATVVVARRSGAA